MSEDPNLTTLGDAMCSSVTGALQPGKPQGEAPTSAAKFLMPSSFEE